MIVIIIGARPQFIKHQPLQAELEKYFETYTIHTGQHYDENMSNIFFDEMGIKKPEINLAIGSSSHGSQTGLMLTEIEKILIEQKAKMILVYGDTNSTLAGALAAAKLHIPIAHIEAGLRSYNRKMPEEVNRVLTDVLSTLLFIPSDASNENLTKEGIKNGIHNVGDIMMDAVNYFLPQTENRANLLTENQLEAKKYYYATIHRPANTDDSNKLKEIISAFNQLDFPVVFPIHPRTKKMLKDFEIELSNNIKIIEPQGYINNLTFLKHTKLLLTDSGGMQKEAFFVKTPCITIRPETEWVETVEQGWNYLVEPKAEKIIAQIREYKIPQNHSPEVYGKGKTAESIVKIIKDYL